MSKVALRKELSGMSKEQLMTLILDLYSARPQAKEYFEFFLDPDENALFDKYMKLIDKEVYRTKRGMMCGRVSIINNYIKDFASFGVSPSLVIDMTLQTAQIIMALEKVYYMTTALSDAGIKLVLSALKRADAAGLFVETKQRIDNMLEASFVSQRYRRRLLESISEYATTMK